MLQTHPDEAGGGHSVRCTEPHVAQRMVHLPWASGTAAIRQCRLCGAQLALPIDLERKRARGGRGGKAVSAS